MLWVVAAPNNRKNGNLLILRSYISPSHPWGSCTQREVSQLGSCRNVDSSLIANVHVQWPDLWSDENCEIIGIISKIERIKKGNDCRLRKGSNSPAPPNCTNFHPFFYPTFFFCNLILIIWNEFYTWSHSKLLFLSPLIIGSKLTFSGWSDRWLPYSAMFRVTSTTIFT